MSAVISGQQQSFTVDVLQGTSHPLILGTECMRTHGVTLNFDKLSVHATSTAVRSKKKTTIKPNSETVIWGKTPKCMFPGFEGICSGSTHISKKCLFVARSLSIISSDQMVPSKILNPTSEPVTIHKNKPLGSFQVRDKTFSIIPADRLGHESSTLQENVRNSNSDSLAANHAKSKQCHTTANAIDPLDRERFFLSYFHHSSTASPMSSDERRRLPSFEP